MKTTALLALGCLALPAIASAQATQLQAIMAPVVVGAGSQPFGPATGRTFNAIYGSLDLAMNYIDAGGKHDVRVQSGNAWTSKLGFYGQEDLGDAWTTLYRLESGLYANTGAAQDTTTLFNRVAVLGLHNPAYGLLTVGRQFTSLGASTLGTDPFLVTSHESTATFLSTASGLGTGASSDALGRLNKTVRYVSPRAAGFGADVSYSLKTDQSVAPRTHARTAVVSYSSAALVASAAYGQSWCDPGITTCASNGVSTAGIRTDIVSASVLSDLGPLVAQAAYYHFAPRSAGAHTADLYLLNAQRMDGQNLYRASLGYRSTTITDNHALSATLGVDHFLSKRTAIYARLGLLRNGSASALSYNTDATGGSVALTAGQSARDFSVGLYQNF